MAETWGWDTGNQESTILAEKHPVPGVEVDNSKVVPDELNEAERGNPYEVSPAKESASRKAAQTLSGSRMAQEAKAGRRKARGKRET